MTKNRAPKERMSESRRTNIILEDINKKFQHISEGHGVLEKEIKDFRHETRADIGFLKFGQNLLSGNLKDLTAKINRIEDKYDKNFKAILEYLSEIDKEINDLRARLVAKADLERLEQLEQRMTRVELVVKRFSGSKEV